MNINRPQVTKKQMFLHKFHKLHTHITEKIKHESCNCIANLHACVTKVYLNSIKIVQFAPQVIIDIIVTSNGEIMSIFAVKRR